MLKGFLKILDKDSSRVKSNRPGNLLGSWGDVWEDPSQENADVDV